MIEVFGFGDEAIATLLVGLVIGAGIPLLLFYLGRTRPQRVVCRQISSSTLVDVKKQVKERISVHFDDSIVTRLSQTTIEISNMGEEVINPAKIKFAANEDATILDASYTTIPEGKALSVSTHTEDPDLPNNEVIMELPFLNSFPKHGETVMLDFIYDGSINEFRTTGGGEGWSLKYVSQEDQVKKARRWSVLYMVIISAITVLAFLTIEIWFVPSSSAERIPPIARIGIGTNTPIVGESVPIVANASGLSLVIEWEVFGVGKIDNNDTLITSYSSEIPGEAIITLRVTDESGQVVTESIFITVEPSEHLPATATP